MKIRKVQRGKMWEIVAENMQELILSGHWEQGSRLPSEATLAQQFGVSRSTLREALRELGSLGLVEMRHGEGNYVSSLDLERLLPPFEFLLINERENILIIMEARRVIEVGTAGLAAMRINSAEVKKLESLLNKMIDSGDDLELFAKTDHCFHRQIALSTKNPVIIKIFDAIEMFLVDQQLEIVSYEGARERGINDHRKIFEAILLGDSFKASEAMRKHMDNTHAAILETLQTD